MADKPIKLTDAQLTTLQQVADPNTRFSEYDLLLPAFDELESLDFIFIKRGGGWIPEPYITSEGRAHLDSIGIAPIPLAPPPKTDKERIAELEAALWKTYADINCYFALEDVSLTEARDVLAEIEGYCQQALGIEE